MQQPEQIIACGEQLSLHPAARRVFRGIFLAFSLLCLFSRPGLLPLAFLWMIPGLLSLPLHLWRKKVSLTITDRRLYGITAWGRKADIPLHAISALSLAPFSGLTVCAQQKTYFFPLLKNQCTLYNFLITLTLSPSSGRFSH